MRNHSLLIVYAFSCFLCHHKLAKVTFDDIDRGSFTSKIQTLFLPAGLRVHAAPFGMFHVNLNKDYIAASSVNRHCYIY